jgi:membrane-bound serine protease (ClpP class)
MGLELGEFTVQPWLIAVIIIAAIAFLIITIIWGVRAHRMKAGAGKEEMIGRSALVQTTLDPQGMVFLEGEQWTAVSEAGRIEPGEEVTVTRVDGLKIYVTKNQ